MINNDVAKKSWAGGGGGKVVVRACLQRGAEGRRVIPPSLYQNRLPRLPPPEHSSQQNGHLNTSKRALGGLDSNTRFHPPLVLNLSHPATLPSSCLLPVPLFSQRYLALSRKRADSFRR